MKELIAAAVEKLCAAFDRGGYNPTPIIDLGVLVSMADGTVDENEREMLLELFQRLLGTELSPEVVGHLVTASMEVAKEAGIDSRARLLAEILLDCDAVEAGILVALAVAFASEGLSKDELGVIERIADAAKLPRARLEKLVARMRTHADGGPMSVRTLLAPESQKTVG
jgi:tellurite resistance protein